MKSILQLPGTSGTILIQSADEDLSLVQGTSKLDDVIESVSESLSKKLEILTSVSEAVSNALKESKKTFDKVEIEFGLSFTAKGNIYVVQAEAEATIKVTLAFDPKTLKG
jgi:hypothetical protein